MTETDINKLPRGIRNNNPGNIRWGSSYWQGLKKDGEQIDPSFCVFISPIYGIRALALILKNYQKLYGLNTVRRVINRYAPPNENQTLAYIGGVAKQLNVSPDTELDLSEPAVLCVFIKAIIRIENGIQPYSGDLIMKGIELS